MPTTSKKTKDDSSIDSEDRGDSSSSSSSVSSSSGSQDHNQKGSVASSPSLSYDDEGFEDDTGSEALNKSQKPQSAVAQTAMPDKKASTPSSSNTRRSSRLSVSSAAHENGAPLADEDLRPTTAPVMSSSSLAPIKPKPQSKRTAGATGGEVAKTQKAKVPAKAKQKTVQGGSTSRTGKPTLISVAENKGVRDEGYGNISRPSSAATSQKGGLLSKRLTEDGLEESMDRLYNLPAQKLKMKFKKEQEDLSYMLSFLEPTRPKSRGGNSSSGGGGVGSGGREGTKRSMSLGANSIAGSTAGSVLGGGGGYVIGNTMRLTDDERKTLLDVFSNQNNANRARLGLGGQWCWPQIMHNVSGDFSPRSGGAFTSPRPGGAGSAYFSGSFKADCYSFLGSLPPASARNSVSAAGGRTLSAKLIDDEDSYMGPPTIQLPSEVIQANSERLHRDGMRSPYRGQKRNKSPNSSSLSKRHPTCIWPKEAEEGSDDGSILRLPKSKIAECSTRFHGELKERAVRQEEAEKESCFRGQGRWMGPVKGLDSQKVHELLERLAQPKSGSK